jgi:glycosyltransferase involved in cell wall biosynthesis
MRSLRICIVGLGGNVHTKRWVEALAGRGHRVLLVTTEPSLELPVSVFNPYEAMGRWRLPKVHRVVAHVLTAQAVNRFKPDLVHMHFVSEQPLIERLAARWPRFVVSVWGRDVIWDGPQPPPVAWVNRTRRILALADEVTATTEFLADHTRPLLRPGQPLTVIPFGVDTDVFRPRDGGTDNGTLTIGFAKHFRRKYGPDVLIRSMIRVRRECPAARLIMVGSRDREPYQRLVDELGLNDVVSLQGPLAYESVPAFMQRLAVFCMPSVYESETFGVAAVEAAACGIPVVASRVGGVQAAVVDGTTGTLVAANDPDALADALIALLKHPERRYSMGIAGRAFACDRYQWVASVDAMESVYARVVSSSPRRHAVAGSSR